MSDSDLVRRAAEGIRPSTAGWTYLSFRTLWRKPDEELAGQTGNEETALIWLGGTADVEGFGAVGERDDVFSGKPSALLLPPGARYRVRATTPLHLAIVSAPAESALPARLIRPDEVRGEIRGKGVTERRIHWILSEKYRAARLLLVEVLTPAGHWSTYPPHKHDEDKAGVERALEELYYYRFNPEQGFAFQGIYTKESPSPSGRPNSPSPSSGTEFPSPSPPHRAPPPPPGGGGGGGGGPSMSPSVPATRT